MHLHTWAWTHCVVVLCLVGVTARASSEFSQNFADSNPADFVFRGYQTLAGALAPRHFDRLSNYYNDTECEVYCNGVELSSNECTGRTTIDCLSILEPDIKDQFRVDLYTRTCEGRFVNQTIESWQTFDTAQACRGVTIMTMRSERKDADLDAWVTDFSYRKLCSTRFLMTIETRVDPKGKRPDTTEVATLCEGSAAMYVDEKGEKNAKKKKKKEVPTAKCNGAKTDWTQPCTGLFEAVEWDGGAECVTTCVGQWSPYVVNWECDGEYNFTRHETEEDRYNSRVRKCSGSAIISSSEYEIGYQLCNGESRFDESYTIPYSTVV